MRMKLDGARVNGHLVISVAGVLPLPQQILPICSMNMFWRILSSAAGNTISTYRKAWTDCSLLRRSGKACRKGNHTLLWTWSLVQFLEQTCSVTNKEWTCNSAEAICVFIQNCIPDGVWNSVEAIGVFIQNCTPDGTEWRRGNVRQMLHCHIGTLYTIWQYEGRVYCIWKASSGEGKLALSSKCVLFHSKAKANKFKGTALCCRFFQSALLMMLVIGTSGWVPLLKLMALQYNCLLGSFSLNCSVGVQQPSSPRVFCGWVPCLGKCVSRYFPSMAGHYNSICLGDCWRFCWHCTFLSGWEVWGECLISEWYLW